MWKVYDRLSDAIQYQFTASNREQYGPLPCKRWIWDGKRHKLNYRSPRLLRRDPQTSDSEMERKAAVYARWLATRDSVRLPDRDPCVIWSGFDVLTATGKRRWETRIRAVSFGKVTIDLPNWDFVPEPMAKLQPLQEAA